MATSQVAGSGSVHMGLHMEERRIHVWGLTADITSTYPIPMTAWGAGGDVNPGSALRIPAIFINANDTYICV